MKGPYHEVLTDPVSRLEAFVAMTAQERLRAGDAQLNFVLAVRLANGIELPDGEVPCRGANRLYARMRRNQGRWA